MSAHAIGWVTAAPLWAPTLHDEQIAEAERTKQMRGPALLRFERDSFMEDIAALLERDPDELSGRVATPVSYRLPAPGESEPPTPAELKLYQAVHGHFNLVAATLVCRRPGLPEHELDSGAAERVAFVLRRQDGDGSEWAWVESADGAKQRSWSRLDGAKAAAVATGEELLPLFPLRYQSRERVRRLFVGLVPTSSGETFKAAGELSPLAEPGSGEGATPADARPDAFRLIVSEPLRALARAPLGAPAAVNDPDGVLSAADEAKIAGAEQARQVEASSFVLLDFAEFLVTQMPGVWQALTDQARPSRASEAALYDQLLGARADASKPTSWRQALVTAWQERLILMGDAEGDSALDLNLKGSAIAPATLEALVGAALPALAAGAASAAAISIQGQAAEPPPVPKLDARGESHYAIRCVYRRPQCGPLRQDVVSDASERFRIGGFFDFDAPVRAINISLPVDTSIKDLRKLRKNVNFLLSNQLREQMNRVTNLKDALDGKFADGKSVDLGLLCSFSLPVITICALIVLMIFISLLNIVFWWMPFLRICFPIGLKAKE